jgi:hypothetical protein
VESRQRDRLTGRGRSAATRRRSEYFFTPIPLGPIPAGAFPLGVGPASPANQPEWNPQVILSWPSAP